MISKEAVNEFKELYKKHYGEELNDFVASEAANRLVGLFKAVYRPIPRAQEEEYNKIKKEQEAVPPKKKIDLVKRLVGDAKVSEFREKIGEKRFWDLVIKANVAKKKTGDSSPTQ